MEGAKVVTLAPATAGDVKAPMPLTAFLNELHRSAIAAGLGDRDFSAIVQVFDGLARAG